MVIETVAPTRSRLSGSPTEAALDRTTAVACPCVNCAPVATFDKVGGLFTAVMLMVVICAGLFDVLPSFTVQVIVRAGSDP